MLPAPMMTVANSNVGDARADGGDDSAGLVADDGGKGHIAPDALDGLVVGGADAAGFDADEDVAVALRLGHGYSFEPEVVEVVEHGGEHRVHGGRS